MPSISEKNCAIVEKLDDLVQKQTWINLAIQCIIKARKFNKEAHNYRDNSKVTQNILKYNKLDQEQSKILILKKGNLNNLKIQRYKEKCEAIRNAIKIIDENNLHIPYGKTVDPVTQENVIAFQIANNIQLSLHYYDEIIDKNTPNFDRKLNSNIKDLDVLLSHHLNKIKKRVVEIIAMKKKLEKTLNICNTNKSNNLQLSKSVL